MIAGWREDVLLVKVTAPPVDSAANEAVIELLSASLGIPKRAIQILRGETSRNKQIRIEGLTLDMVKARLTTQIIKSSSLKS